MKWTVNLESADTSAALDPADTTGNSETASKIS